MTREHRKALKKLTRLYNEFCELEPKLVKLHLTEIPELARMEQSLARLRELQDQRRAAVTAVEQQLQACGITLDWHSTTGAELLAFLGR